MARPKPPLVPLSQLTPGQHADFFALLAERTRSSTRDGKPFYTCRFRDAQRTATFMVWADSPVFEVCEKDWKPGQFFKIRAIYGEHERYGAQIEVEQLRPVTEADKADGFDPAAFVEVSRFQPDAMFAELQTLAEQHIADVPLRKLVLTILDRHAGPLKALPATERRFYPFPGGLLEHILSVTHSAIHLADKYSKHYPHLQPPLNRDLVTAGAILHDIGRVLEYGPDPVSLRKTVPGEFFGHLFLGRDLVRDTARELGDVNPELVLLLEHIVLTHLALPEWGSPRLPLIPEVIIIHHADDLDAKLEMYARCLHKDKADGPFTERDPSLGRALYKGRQV